MLYVIVFTVVLQTIRSTVKTKNIFYFLKYGNLADN